MSSESEAQIYRALVLAYEDLGKQIQGLLRQHAGHTKDMPPDVLAHYRQLAAERDDRYSQMKAIEATWLEEES